MHKEYLTGLLETFLHEHSTLPEDKTDLRVLFSNWLKSTEDTQSDPPPERRQLRSMRTRRARQQPTSNTQTLPLLKAVSDKTHRTLNLYLKKALKGTLLLPSTDRLEYFRQAFLDRFGPSALRSLSDMDAIDVLAIKKDSQSGMDHWLEFRHDDVFDGQLFGSIKGGSALKFSVYQDNEGIWKHKEEGKRQVTECSIETVAQTVGQRRDELIAAAEACALWATQSSDRDPWQLAHAIAAAAPRWHSALWLQKYLHIVHPNILGNIRPRMLHAFGLQVANNESFGLLRVDGLPSTLAIDAHIGNILESLPALSWVPPLQRWSIIRQAFGRQIEFLDESITYEKEEIVTHDEAVGDLLTSTIPRRGSNRKRLRSIRKIKMSRSGDIFVVKTGQVLQLNWTPHTLEDGSSKSIIQYTYNSASHRHAWGATLLYSYATPPQDIGTVEADLIHEGHGQWPDFYKLVGPPQSRIPRIGKVRQPTHARIHAALSDGILNGGLSPFSQYSLNYGINHLLLEPDLKKVRQVLLNPIVHQIALKENGVTQILAAWQRLEEPTPNRLWKAAIEKHLAKATRPFLRLATEFTLKLRWHEEALWIGTYLMEKKYGPIETSDRLLISQTLVRNGRLSEALKELEYVDTHDIKLRKEKISLLISLGLMNAAQKELEQLTTETDSLNLREMAELMYLSARLHLTNGDFEHAFQMAEESLNTKIDLMGPDDFALLPVLDLIHTLHQNKENSELALEAMDEMIRISMSQYGKGHRFVLKLLLRKSVLLETSEAIALLRTAMDSGTIRLGPTAPSIHEIRLALAQALFDINEGTNAIAILEQALKRAHNAAATAATLSLLLRYTLDLDTSMARIWVFQLMTQSSIDDNDAMKTCEEAFERLGLPGWSDRLMLTRGIKRQDARPNPEPTHFSRDVAKLRIEVNRLQKEKGRRHPDTLQIRYAEWRITRKEDQKAEIWSDILSKFGLHHPATIQASKEMNQPLTTIHPLLEKADLWF